MIVRLAEPLAGTVIEVGVVMRLSAPPIEPAPYWGGIAPAPLVGAGTNMRSATAKVCAVPVRLLTRTDLGVAAVWLPLIFPKLAETGENQTLARFASVRSSRPAPWSCGPTVVAALNAFSTTRSDVLVRADLTWAGVQFGWMSLSTAAEPATCGELIDVPL